MRSCIFDLTAALFARILSRSFHRIQGDSMEITSLGEARFDNPMSFHVDDAARVRYNVIVEPGDTPTDDFLFEVAGPRRRIFFDPPKTRAGIVTCGGLCPGVNNVIRAIVLELYHRYGVRDIFGFRNGYSGLDPRVGEKPIPMTPGFVEDIHKDGGTVLNTSRGPVDIRIAVDNLIARRIDILFTIGGDGTQRGGAKLFHEARRRGYKLAVVGIPKTIDNDVAFVSRTFGYLTAVEEVSKVINCAHTEAHSVRNGVALVKVMGRNAGFIAAGATIASQDVNFTLVPELPFVLDGENGFLSALKLRLIDREHAVVIAAEGAGQHFFSTEAQRFDASGNPKLNDVGAYLRQRIEAYLSEEGLPSTLRYFDPSYLIRSVPANAEDAILCNFFARNAVHAAMAGKTGILIGHQHDTFTHVPIELLEQRKKQLDIDSPLWHGVVSSTGQNFACETEAIRAFDEH
jgi:6-phosphofructokinase 1